MFHIHYTQFPSFSILVTVGHAITLNLIRVKSPDTKFTIPAVFIFQKM